jgi:deoxycytidine triphosphate deaminase
MIVPHQEILKLCGLLASDPGTKEGNFGPIQPCLKSNVRSAGYDLRLGTQYYLPNVKDEGADDYGGLVSVRTLDLQKAATICIPANQVIIVSMIEKLSLPDDMVGHLSLKLDLLLKGVIMASQSQIDAGYKGGIFALLYNLSNEEVCIKHGSPVLRMELATLSQVTDEPYKGDYGDKPLSSILSHRIRSGLFTMRQDLDSAKKGLTWTQLIGAAMAAFLGVAPALFTYFGLYENRMNKLETTIEAQVKQRELEVQNLEIKREAAKEELQLQIDALKKEVEELKARK